METAEREFSQLKTEIQKLSNNGPILLTGDFNAKLKIDRGTKKQARSRNGKLLEEMLSITILTPVSKESQTGTWTRVNRKKTSERSPIDYIMIKKSERVKNLKRGRKSLRKKAAKAIKNADSPKKGTPTSLPEHTDDHPPKDGSRERANLNNNEKNNKRRRHKIKNLLESETQSQRKNQWQWLPNNHRKWGYQWKQGECQRTHNRILWKPLPSQGRQTRIHKLNGGNQANSKKTSWIHGDEQTNTGHTSKGNHRSNQETKKRESYGTRWNLQSNIHRGQYWHHGEIPQDPQQHSKNKVNPPTMADRKNSEIIQGQRKERKMLEWKGNNPGKQCWQGLRKNYKRESQNKGKHEWKPTWR